MYHPYMMNKQVDNKMTKVAKVVTPAVSYHDALDFNLATSSIGFFGSTGIINPDQAAELRNTGAMKIIGDMSSALLALTGDGQMGGVAYGKKARRKLKKDKVEEALVQVETMLNTPVGKTALIAVKFVRENLDSIYKL